MAEQGISRAYWGCEQQLRCLARSLVHDADADDLVQDTWLRTLTHGKTARNPVTWAKEVLRNNYRMRMRGDLRRRARERDAKMPAAQDRPGHADGARLDDLIDKGAFAEALESALEQLDEPFRTVVVRRFYEEMSAQDIALRSGTPVGTVRWQTHEGLRRLRVALDRRFRDRDTWTAGLLAFALTRPRRAMLPFRRWATKPKLEPRASTKTAPAHRRSERV